MFAPIFMALSSSLPMLGLVFTPTTWLPFAVIAVLVVALVAAIVYMLAGVINSNNARAWSRMQIYEAMLSLLLIIIFGAFSYLFFLNPQPAFGPSGLNIVPQSFSVLGFNIAQGCSNANDIFNLSVCDLSLFNGAASTAAAFTYYVSFIAGIIPTLSVGFFLPETEQSVGVKFKFEIFPGEIDDLLPFIYSGIIFALLLSQLQLIILSGSLLFLSVFLTIGLVMRTLGVTRSFGGAMIAFGLGLGMVFPLLTSITYGFIDVNISSLSSGLGYATLAGEIFSLILAYLTGTSLPVLTSGATFFGYLIAGLTFIPFLNFTIVDAFIVDFSKAVGERMDFMSLLTNII
ncbi:MAG: hypothetical protein ACP5K5_00595 [Candidatus Micrarchaeia archaeon]